MSKRKSVYEIVNTSITERLREGVIPWRPKWKGSEPPKNVITHDEYEGINAMILLSQKRDCAYWLSMPEIQRLGGTPKADARPVEIIDGRVDALSMLMVAFGGIVDGIKVYNADDIEGISSHVPKVEHKCSTDFSIAQKIVSDYRSRGPKITNDPEDVGLDNPCYYPPEDLLFIYDKNRFYCEDGYYLTLFHEEVHSTGHPDRLNRFSKGSKIPPQVISQVMKVRRGHAHGLISRQDAIEELDRLGKQVLRDESMEELIAEFGAAYLAAEAKIDATTIDDSSIYINNWLKKAGEDEKFLVTAAAKAQEAVNYILGKSPKSGTPKRSQTH